MKLTVLVFAAVNLATASCAPDVRFEGMLAARFAQPYGDFQKPAADPNIPELAKELGLTDLDRAVEYLNLTDILASTGPFTVFGPTNAAFQDVPKKFFRFMVDHKKVFGEILTYHVLPEKVLSDSLKNDQLIKSLDGREVRINIYDNKVITASGRPIIKVDKTASNGVIHVIDGVMYPPLGDVGSIISYDWEYKSILWAAINIAGLRDYVKGPGPLTLLAPGDSAFHKLEWCSCWLFHNKEALKKVVLNHVVKSTQYRAGMTNKGFLTSATGDKLEVLKYKTHTQVGGAFITSDDITATNGVVQIIDKVLFPEELKYFCWDPANDVKECRESSFDYFKSNRI